VFLARSPRWDDARRVLLKERPDSPVPSGSVIPPPAEPPRASLKARLSSARPRRDTPTNPGPAVAPAVPSLDDPLERLARRSKTGTTPPVGVPVEVLQTSAAPGEPAADTDPTLRDLSSANDKQAS